MLIHGLDYATGEVVPVAVLSDGTPASASLNTPELIASQKAVLNGLIMLSNELIPAPTVPQQATIDEMVAAEAAL